MLLLDDPRWTELDHRGWSRGERSSQDPDAPYVPDELRALILTPSDLARFRSLWPYLCSEGTAWSAAYAAVPYLVDIAASLSPSDRFEYIYFAGLVRICEAFESGPSFQLKPYLADSYHAALERALFLLSESIVCSHDLTETRYLLAAAAALKGHRKLGDVLNDLDTFTECSECGAEVFEYAE